MRLLPAVALLLFASCAEAEEFLARPGDRDAGAFGGAGTFTSGDAATSGIGGIGGSAGRAGGGIGGTDASTAATGGAGSSGAAGGAGGALDAGFGGSGGKAGTRGTSDAGTAGNDGGPTCAAACALKVQYQNTTSPPEPMTATVRVRVDVVNTGTKSVALADLIVRYWFTDAGGSGDKATCYYAQDGCAALTTTFAPVAPPRRGADRHLDIGFSGAGTLAPGAHTGTISIGVQHLSGGAPYDQTDDYSYGASQPNLVDWPTVTAYVGGTLSWGVEP